MAQNQLAHWFNSTLIYCRIVKKSVLLSNKKTSKQFQLHDQR